MIKSDYHVHSHFSGDCDIDMKTYIEVAIEKGIENLCFTEHHDIDFPYEGISFLLDIDMFTKTLLAYKDYYKDKIALQIGIEIGIQPHLYNTLSELVDAYPFDFILCSNHLANGVDPYDSTYYENKTKYAAYEEYFLDLLTNVKNFDNFDVFGHLDYVVRYGPYEDKTYHYNTFKDILDAILLTIIEKGKGIELNTSGFKKFITNPHPNIEVIKRYRELGGEIITIGSDSHTPDNLLYGFDLAENILKDAGFKYYTVFKNRKAEFIKF